jgi:hypothetical protein
MLRWTSILTRTAVVVMALLLAGGSISLLQADRGGRGKKTGTTAGTGGTTGGQTETENENEANNGGAQGTENEVENETETENGTTTTGGTAAATTRSRTRTTTSSTTASTKRGTSSTRSGGSNSASGTTGTQLRAKSVTVVNGIQAELEGEVRNGTTGSRFKAEVENVNLPVGSQVAFCVGPSGSTTLAGASAVSTQIVREVEVELDSRNGDTVPVVNAGDVLEAHSGADCTGALLATATFKAKN